MSFKVFDKVISGWFVTFVVCGLPLTLSQPFRQNRFSNRKLDDKYQTGFVDEIKVLSGNVYPENQDYLKMRNFYGFYLSVYTLLFVVYRFVG
jgi:hypothetical protein